MRGTSNTASGRSHKLIHVIFEPLTDRAPALEFPNNARSDPNQFHRLQARYGHGIIGPDGLASELRNIVSIAVLSDRAGSASALHPYDCPQRYTDEKEGKRGRHRPDSEKHRRSRA